MRVQLVLVFIGACLAAQAGESPSLLLNAGFETVSQGRPSQWHRYVEPMEGAEAALDESVARGGDYSVRIHNPRPYDVEPANNWSQNIVRNLAGQTLNLSGYIKTDNASEAALWIQCFRQRPWRILREVTSSYDTFVGGTNDWTRVNVTAEVPEGTDFVVVRCVLQGEGTAWFDDVTMTADPVKPEVREDSDAKPSAESPIVTESPVADAVPELPEPPAVLNDAAALETLQSMREAGESIQESNRAIMEEIQRMRDEMQALQQEMLEKQQELKALQEPQKPPPPPLVPRGNRQDDAL